MECILQCSTNNNCGALTCCGPIQEREFTFRQRVGQQNGEAKRNCESSEIEAPELETSKYDFAQISCAIETTV